MKQLIGVLCWLVLVLQMPAYAQSEEEKNAMSGAAMLMVADKWCRDEYSIDVSFLEKVFAAFSIDVTTEPNKTYFADEVKDVTKLMGEHGAVKTCAVIYGVYGPSGTVGGGFMMKK